MAEPLRISVFTPSHDTRFLNDCYLSMRAQTFADWEWIVVIDEDVPAWEPPEPDPRIRVVRGSFPRKVGAVKYAACELCEGEILFELDHDDVIAPTCLEEVHDAFAARPEIAMVYSDCAQINEDGSRNDDRFDSQMGWEYSEETQGGFGYLRCHALAPYPHNVALIWFAPNHLRAFSRRAYVEAGKYDATLTVLDDQDLMMRLLLVGDFHHIDRCLYFQRVHAGNTQRDPATNAFIQEQTVRYYDEYIHRLAIAWSERNDLEVIAPQTLTSPPPLDDNSNALVLDPDDPVLPYPDSSVGLISAVDLLQRIGDRVKFFNECYRVLVHGGLLLTRTPSTDGRGAFQDPSHVAFYNENSFWYLTESRRKVHVPGYEARFQVSRLRTHFPSEWDREVNISYVDANLVAIKDGPRMGGLLQC